MAERDTKGDQEGAPADENRRRLGGTGSWIALLLIGLLATVLVYEFSARMAPSRISWSYFEHLIDGEDFDGRPIRDARGDVLPTNIERITWMGEEAVGIFRVIPPAEPTVDEKGQRVESKVQLKQQFQVRVPDGNSPAGAALYNRLREKNITVEKGEKPIYDFTTLLFLGLLLFLPVALVIFIMRRMQNQMMGGGAFLSNFSRSTAKRYEPSEKQVTFDDVAGLEGIKADLVELVDYLKDPSKFQRLGGQIPKGVLMFGPPGTGKTLLARAVAGEAQVPFYSVNGSEFIQMFVGVGASRVRDLFATAKRHAPAIIFIDEIDAVGRQRGAGLGGGHDEREQTLNQILSEMDGFQKNDSVIVIAATNRPDVLDPALLRPGRFDRHVTVTRPTQKGRLGIFKVHVRDVPLAAEVNLEILANATAGMTGADIANLVNEAALWAARNNKTQVGMSDFYYAQDKVMMGARREEVLSEREKRRTAYHEAGHTIAAWNLSGAMPVHKVTIIPRGQALGVTQMVPLEDRLNMTQNELDEHLIFILSGRAAEQLVFDELTVGAENDLEKGTSLARRMVAHWGMSPKLGPVSFKIADDDPFLGREIHKNRQFSEHTMELIDEEVARILRNAAISAVELLAEKRDDLDKLALALIAKEELDQREITELIGPSVHEVRPGQHPVPAATK